jgi:uncharacterized delta-60 repeat protein
MKKILLLLAFSFTVNTVFSQAGSLDTSFNFRGIRVEAIDSSAIARTGVLQADGKILALGTSNSATRGRDIALVRYNTDGNNDNSFGNNGVVTTDVNRNEDFAESIDLQADGKIVVAGYFDGSNATNGGLFVIRYLPNGSLDPSFGTGGKVIVPSPTYNYYYVSDVTVKVLRNGNILLAANIGPFYMTMFDARGNQITSFTPFPIYVSRFYVYPNGYLDQNYGKIPIAIQEDDKILIAGSVYKNGNALNGTDFIIMRFMPDGTADTRFGNNGIIRYNSGERNDHVYSMTVLNDGGILLGGTINSSNLGSTFGIAKFTPSGQLDLGFGNNGFTRTQIGDAGYDVGTSLAVQPDGKIVLVGYTFITNYAYDFAVARYNSNGLIDATFGNQGKVTTNVGYPTDQAYKVLLQPDGKIVAIGKSFSDVADVFAVARYNGAARTGSGGSGGSATAELNADIYNARLFPNPLEAKGLLNLEYTLPQDQRITVGIYDVLGRLVQTVFTQEYRKAGAQKEQIRLNGQLQKGICFLRISGDSGVQSMSIMVE